METRTDYEWAKDYVHEDEHLLFLDSVSFLLCALRKLPEAFGMFASKSWYPHYFNTRENLNYVDSIPDMTYYGVDDMQEEERKEFLPVTRVGDPRLSTIGTFWKRTVKMTSPC